MSLNRSHSLADWELAVLITWWALLFLLINYISSIESYFTSVWFLLQFFPSEKRQGKFKRHFIYPLLTTAVWPNLLTSRCRLGFGKIFHSSQAERQKTKHISNNLQSFQQNTRELYFNCSRINQQVTPFRYICE